MIAWAPGSSRYAKQCDGIPDHLEANASVIIHTGLSGSGCSIGTVYLFGNRVSGLDSGSERVDFYYQVWHFYRHL